MRIDAPGGYREAPRFEERPLPRPRAVVRAAWAASALVVVRVAWLVIAWGLMMLAQALIEGTGAVWPALAIVPGALLCAQLVGVTWMTMRRHARAARALRITATWMRVQQVVVVLATVVAMFALFHDLEPVFVTLVIAAPATWMTWWVARALDDASHALDS